MENFDHTQLTVKPDPWLGTHTARICTQAGANRPWARLLARSTHINHLVHLDRSWKLVPEKVQAHLDHGIIVNMSCDPFNHWEDYVVNELSNYTDRFLVLSGDVTYLDQPKPNICFVPYLFLWQKYTYDPLTVNDNAKSYRLSCMNKIARYHRIENFIKLKHKPYFDQLLFHMWYNYDRNLIKGQTVRKYYNTEIIKEFESLIPESLPQFADDPHRIDLPAYTQCYTNLVTETSVYEGTIFMSEKTCRPFMTGQFGLWLSNPGLVRHLRSWGLDTFDDVFDGHIYDSELNLNLRIDMLHDMIDRLMDMDMPQIWTDTLSRRQANVDKFYSQELENFLTAQCEQYLHLV